MSRSKPLREKSQRATHKTRVDLIQMKQTLEHKVMRDQYALERMSKMIQADRWSKDDIVFLNQRLLKSRL